MDSLAQCSAGICRCKRNFYPKGDSCGQKLNRRRDGRKEIVEGGKEGGERESGGRGIRERERERERGKSTGRKLDACLVRSFIERSCTLC